MAHGVGKTKRVTIFRGLQAQHAAHADEQEEQDEHEHAKKDQHLENEIDKSKEYLLFGKVAERQA